MKFIVKHYLRTILTIIVGFLSIVLLQNKLFDNDELVNEIGLEEPAMQMGFTKDYFLTNKYSFDVDDTVTICMEEDYEPKEYANATYYDGTDLKDYVVVQNAPKDTNTPGTYDVEYIFIFEGEQVIKNQTLIIEDNSSNNACPVWEGGSSCVFDSDCPSNTKCVLSPEEDKKVCMPEENDEEGDADETNI